MQQPLVVTCQPQVKKDNWLFTKIAPLIKGINQQTDQLYNEQLKDYTIKESDCEDIIKQLKKILAETPTNKNVYAKILFHFFGQRTFFILFYNTIKDMLQLGNILLLDRSTTSLREHKSGEFQWAIVYLFSMVVIDFVKTYIASKIMRHTNLYMLRVKVILQYLIFTKIFKTLSVGESAGSQEGNETNYVANLNTLLTADIDQVFLIQYCFKDGWSAILIVVSCLFLLYQRDSYAGTMVVLTILATTVYNLLVVYFMITAKSKMLKQKDLRVSLSSDVIEGIKQIKYLTWQETFSNKIMAIRKVEFKNLAVLKIFDGFCSIFWNNISYLLLFMYITSILRDGKSLQEINVFTIVAIFNSMVFPFGILPWCINSTMLAWVSLKRIKAFLLLPDIDPLNRFQIGYPAQPTQVLLMEDLTFEWPNNENSTEQTQISADQVQDIDESNDETTKFMLRIDKLEIQHNSLNFVVGRIGSGKTALFNAILNELSKDTQYNQQSKSIITHNSFAGERLMTICDQIIIKGSLGYCSQTTWVQNATIRQNILFGKEYDAYSYKMCIEACELQKDLSLFEKGDLHEIGPDGKNLSGGQKQRITLARAFYQDSDIYLLDDVFSSLDVHVADIVFKKSIIDYLITKGKTVLLITSHYRYIQLAKNYLQPNIIYIDNGQIIDDQQVINEFIEDQTKKEEEQEIEESIEEEIQQMIPTLRKQHSSVKQMEYHHKNEYDDAEESEEQREQGKIDSSTWIMYFSNMNWILFILFIIFSFMTQGAMSLVDFWLKAELNQGTGWLHNITVWFDNDFQKAFMYLTIMAITITFIRAIFYVSSTLKTAWVIFSKLNDSLMQSVMQFFDSNNSGRIINRIQDDTDMIDDQLPWTLHVLLENLSRVVGFAVGLTILFPILGLGIIGIIFMYYQISKIYTKANRELKRLKSINNGKVLSMLNETITGIKIIRAFSKQNYFETTYIYKLSQMVLSEQCAERSKQWFDVRLLLLSNLLLVFVVILISTLLLSGAEIDYTQCALTLTYSLIILESCYDTFNFYLDLEQRMISVERVKQYYNNPQEYLQEPIYQRKQLTKDNILKLYKQQEFQTYQCDNIADSVIMFKNVFLTYDDPTLSTTKLALKNVSFTIQKGDKIAFVGRTGSGKTSILNTLFRMYDIQYGEIYINGQNTINMTLKQLRQQMSVVPQFGFLYNATIKDNLDPQNLNTSEEIERLFEETGFTLRGIKADKQQCNTNFMVSANGGNLSNGEKQVINFLRVMLQNKQIVCLDEATSNMDPQTDQLLHKLLFKYVEDRTLIVITHRLENIGCYDRIVVMEQGEIVEQGSLNELLQIEGGFFNRLMDHHKEQMK